MPTWKSLTSKPAGALPANLVGKVGVLLITVLLIALVLSVSLTSDEPDDPAGSAPADPQQPIVAPGRANDLRSQIEQHQRQQEYQHQLEQREAERQRIRDEVLFAGGAGQLPPDPAGSPSADPDTGETLTREEYELRQTIRLEELERQLRSLRTQPVAQSRRDPGSAPLEDAGTAPALHMQPFAAPPSTDTENVALARPRAGAAANSSGYTPTPGSLDIPLPDSSNLPDYDHPPRFTLPPDPPGWERIHEGSLVEAVLVNQLSGDFPSPVLALVAVPFYSTDRQRVLIPRGSRFVGTAQPVRGQDQDSLAVGFHRVILPDGRHIPLRFQALNQIGEGALSDQVNRHYFSTFLAAGAVGVMSGLAALGGNPYAGGLPGLQSGFSGGSAAAGQNIMNRFLNRLPEVTIRAGHRLRIWFTSDALFPIT